MRRIIIIAAALLAGIITTPALSEEPSTPEARLLTAYVSYAHFAWCHSIREQDADISLQIRDADLDRARATVK